MIEITAIRLAGGFGHEHVTDVLWRGAVSHSGSSTTFGQTAIEGVVEWLSASAANSAVVSDGSTHLPVVVARPPDRAPFISACADGEWSDALLALPRF